MNLFSHVVQVFVTVVGVIKFSWHPPNSSSRTHFSNSNFHFEQMAICLEVPTSIRSLSALPTISLSVTCKVAFAVANYLGASSDIKVSFSMSISISISMSISEHGWEGQKLASVHVRCVEPIEILCLITIFIDIETTKQVDVPVSLWVWGRALAPRVSSIVNTQLQRRRATPSDPTKCKKSLGSFLKQLKPGINSRLSTTDLGVPSIAWQWSVVCYYRIS